MIRWLLTGGAIPLFLVICGMFFMFYLRLLPFRRPLRMLRTLTAPSPQAGTSPFRAVMLALAGTLGVGNIVGVANAIWIGGAGAIFWMWVCAFVAMILKYAEILLAVSHRRMRRDGSFFGGAYYYIKDYFGSVGMMRIGILLSVIFAVFMILNAFTMGCVVQVNAVSMAFSGIWRIPTWISGILLLALALPVVVRGGRGIAALTELLVPIMTGGYILLSLAVLLIRREEVGAAFSSIFQSAFSAESMGGGIIGFFSSQALRVGTMRGLLSNEAGCGTAPTAHAGACSPSPAAQGVWGIFEVFVDTVLLCTATALVILVNYREVEMLGSDAVMMTVRAYSCVLGDWAGVFLGIAIFCFAYATVLCWANYGLEALNFLSGKAIWKLGYFALFSVCVVFGALAAPDSIWDLSDFAVAVLTTVNIGTLFLMRREVRKETDRNFGGR